MSRAAALAVALAVALGAPTRGAAQDSDYIIANVPYDGRFTFARIRFEPSGTFGQRGAYGPRDLKWDHDFPRSERHFMRILREVTLLRPYMDGGNILTLDDPELFKYPVAYLCEPGFWVPTDKEAESLRRYLAKGGFLIFDDFFGSHWLNFERSLKKVLPDARLVELDPSHPIFDAFFRVQSLDMDAMGQGGFSRGRPQFLGVYEDNDPAKRLMIVVNYNTDIGDYWEWSDAGFIPVQISNEAYKIGVNYIVYGMTH